MRDHGNGYWEARWGRVGGSFSTMDYPIAEWDKKYHEKIRKGYKDVTAIVATAHAEPDTVLDVIGVTPAVSQLINFLQSCAKGVLRNNYTVAIADVTMQQVQRAQDILNALIGLSQKKKIDIGRVNDTLLEMYHVIPRKMGNVRDFLLDSPDVQFFTKLLGNEQDLLDVMQGQVATQIPAKSGSSVMNLSDLGLTIELATDEQIEEIRKNTDYDVRKALHIYHITHKAQEDAYASIPIANEQLLYHGSRNENWWSIINQGLRIRPANAIHTGSMFGDGIYAANKARKSIGYTSLRGSYWASGNSKKAYIALYRFNLGKSWDLLKKEKHQSWMTRIDQTLLDSKKYNSVFARGGADLRNDEYIVYQSQRCTPKYLIEIGA